MCVGGGTFWNSGKGLARNGTRGSTSLSISLTLLSPEGGMVRRDRLYKMEHADVMTLLVQRHDRIIGPLSRVPE